MSTYLGWPVVAMPSLTTAAGTPVVPSGFEFRPEAAVAMTMSDFSKKQQTYPFNAKCWIGSVYYSGLPSAQGDSFSAFLDSCNGSESVFQFPSGLCALFPSTLTSDGTTPRYWRLKEGSIPQIGIKTGKVYSVTFEVREAK